MKLPSLREIDDAFQRASGDREGTITADKLVAKR